MLMFLALRAYRSTDEGDKSRKKPSRQRQILSKSGTIFFYYRVFCGRLSRVSSDTLPAGVTQLLGQWSGGDGEALDELMPLVYDELRRMAHRHMANERGDHTLQPTALVNEAFLRMKDGVAANWQNRAQFFAVAAQMMRHILVDYARRHTRAKRGGGAHQVTLDDAMLVSKDTSDELLALDDALQKLEQFDKRKSQVATMRFFAGLSVAETAEALGISTETVTRDWRLARAWLRNALNASA
jgi:RNA polymerase sigma factor (TIGR02999 family)